MKHDQAALSPIAIISEWMGLSGSLIKYRGIWTPECGVAQEAARAAPAKLGGAVFDRGNSKDGNEGS